MNALSSLPSVIRSSSAGLLGNLLIRGANETANRYFIDGIPVLYPQHFGGLQSVISNELIERIDLYSSNFPAPFGQAQGAIIDITTKDTVKDFNSKLIVSLLSSDVYFENTLPSFYKESNYSFKPLNNIREKENRLETQTGNEKEQITRSGQKKRRRNQGYWIASGRISYLTLTLSPILKAISKDDNDEFQLPQYYDYQLKGKYFLDQKTNHSIGLLFFGFYDITKFIRTKPKESDIQNAIRSREDPLFANSSSNLNNSIFSNNIGLYYRFFPSTKIDTQVSAFIALNRSKFFANIDALEDYGLNPKTLDINIKPNVYGLKNSIEFLWFKEIAFLRFGLESLFYDFRSNGVTQAITNYSSTGPPDFGDDSLFRRVNINFSNTNITLSSFLENTLDIYGLKIVTGIHLAYLDLNQTITYDPRLLLSYEFDWEMVLSAGYGLYSSFPQVNYFLFNRPFNQQPEVARSSYIQPERARHISAGVEQTFPVLLAKVEGFYNTFSDQLVLNPDTESSLVFINSAEIRSTGFELLIRLSRDKRRNTFYGWVSYTYTNAIKNSNLDPEVSPYGDQFLNAEFEQPHSLKLIMGYIFGQNNVGLGFELNSGFPYTPISGSERNDIPGIERHSPVYDKPFSERFPLRHRLDVRYTRTSIFNWGSIDWYLEVINIYYYRPIAQLSWDYNKPYEEGNPQKQKSPLSFIIPGFGVEIRF